MPAPELSVVNLDGQERKLLFRPSDAIAAENALGGESFEESIQRRGFRRLATWLWAGLRYQDQRLTIEQTARILDKANARGMDYGDLWNVVSEAMVKSNLLRLQREGNGTDPLERPAPPRGSSEP